MLDLVLKRLFFSILAGEASAAPGPRTISLNQNFFNFTHGDSLPRHSLKNGFPSLLSISLVIYAGRCVCVCVCVQVNVLYLNAENHLQDCKDVDDSRMSDDDVVVDYKKHSRRRVSSQETQACMHVCYTAHWSCQMIGQFVGMHGQTFSVDVWKLVLVFRMCNELVGFGGK